MYAKTDMAIVALQSVAPRAPHPSRSQNPHQAALLSLQRAAGNAAVVGLLEEKLPAVQGKWVAQQGAKGIWYQHHIGGVRNPAKREYKYVQGVAYVDDKDDVWSERRDEEIYPRGDVKATFKRTPYGTRAVGQSAKKFNFAMRLRKAPPDAELIVSSQKVLDAIERKYGIKGLKVSKIMFKKHKLSKKAGVIRGRTFRYLPGVVKVRRPKAAATAKKSAAAQKRAAVILSRAKRPLGTPSTSPKTYQAVFTAPAAKAGRSSTAGAFNGVGAGIHAGAHSSKLPIAVQPASQRRWEWLHLVGDALGGPTTAANLAAGTFDSNSRHNAIEEAVARASQTATPADPITYRVTAQLIAGTEIATQFVCEASRPSQQAGAWYRWDPIDTLTTTKEDRVEDHLYRHAQHSGFTKF